MSRPFRTYRQQLTILRNRGLEIKDGSKVIRILKRENYYSVINGYKDIFLDKSSIDEKYKQGTSFEDIYILFDFDRNIRHLFLKYILKIESLIGTKISYYFSERNRKEFGYLNINNFHPNKLESNTNLIANISSVIKDKSKQNKSNQISHHLTKHKDLPLWVLVKQLTFGTTAYFYSSLPDDIKDNISNEISKEFCREYKKSNIVLKSNELENSIHFLNFLRNKCAHNERFFNIQNAKKQINYPHTNITFKGRLFDAVILLKFFLFKKDFSYFKKELIYEILKLKKELNSSILNKILIEMGLPKKWEELI